MYIEAGQKRKNKNIRILKIFFSLFSRLCNRKINRSKINNNFKVNILGVTSIHNIKRFINLDKNNKDNGNEDNIDTINGIELGNEINKVDFIISPIDIEDKYRVPIIKVSSMLSEEDMNKLKEIFILKNSFKDNQ